MGVVTKNNIDNYYFYAKGGKFYFSKYFFYSILPFFFILFFFPAPEMIVNLCDQKSLPKNVDGIINSLSI